MYQAGLVAALLAAVLLLATLAPVGVVAEDVADAPLRRLGLVALQLGREARPTLVTPALPLGAGELRLRGLHRLACGGGLGLGHDRRRRGRDDILLVPPFDLAANATVVEELDAPERPDADQRRELLAAKPADRTLALRVLHDHVARDERAVVAAELAAGHPAEHPTLLVPTRLERLGLADLPRRPVHPRVALGVDLAVCQADHGDEAADLRDLLPLARRFLLEADVADRLDGAQLHAVPLDLDLLAQFDPPDGIPVGVTALSADPLRLRRRGRGLDHDDRVGRLLRLGRGRDLDRRHHLRLDGRQHGGHDHVLVILVGQGACRHRNQGFHRLRHVQSPSLQAVTKNQTGNRSDLGFPKLSGGARGIWRRVGLF